MMFGEQKKALTFVSFFSSYRVIDRSSNETVGRADTLEGAKQLHDHVSGMTVIQQAIFVDGMHGWLDVNM